MNFGCKFMKGIKSVVSALGCCLAFLSVPSVAADKISGVFVVEKGCEAHRSIRKQSNPVTPVSYTHLTLPTKA